MQKGTAMANSGTIRLGLRSGCLTLAAAVALGGCGGGQTNNAPIPPLPNSKDTGTFFSKDDDVLVGTGTLVHVARSYVTLDHGVPKAIGMLWFASAVKDLPLPAKFGIPDAYGVNLPPESVYTPFSFIAVGYFSGHNPRPAGGIPHIHPIFGMGPPQQPDSPGNANENKPIAAAELPQDSAPLDDVAGGIGRAVQDPGQPQAKAGWDTTGQNYFYYGGHMNAIALGATNHFMLLQEQGAAGTRTDVIKQPQVYPRPGYYPHRYTMSYDPVQRAHIFEMEDFQKATNVLP